LRRDWKKLTFFYYAESYINFNDLVQDLFKIYKTRIWMSAINPASFATSSSIPLHMQHAIAPGAIMGTVAPSMHPNGYHAAKDMEQEGVILGVEAHKSAPFNSNYAYQKVHHPFGYVRPQGQASPIPQGYGLRGPPAFGTMDRLSPAFGDINGINGINPSFQGRPYHMQAAGIPSHTSYPAHNGALDPWHRTRVNLYDDLPHEFSNLGFS
jgi:hypothetical protein